MAFTRKAGRDASLVIPIVDEQGASVTVTSAQWALIDDTGAEVASGTGAVQGISDVQVTIPSAHLTVQPGAAARGFQLDLDATHSNGSVVQTEYLVIEPAQKLTRFASTVISYPEALAIRTSFGPSLTGWDEASDETRQSAMAHAFDNLARITYRVGAIKEGARASDYAAYGTGSDDIFDLSRKVRLRNQTADTFADLPENFRTAIARAQLIEADQLLGGSPTMAARESGIISETIGESSTFYNSKPVLNVGVSQQAYALLKPYISISITIGR